MKIHPYQYGITDKALPKGVTPDMALGKSMEVRRRRTA
jgi:hypothetical protein